MYRIGLPKREMSPMLFFETGAHNARDGMHVAEARLEGDGRVDGKQAAGGLEDGDLVAKVVGLARKWVVSTMVAGELSSRQLPRTSARTFKIAWRENGSRPLEISSSSSSFEPPAIAHASCSLRFWPPLSFDERYLTFGVRLHSARSSRSRAEPPLVSRPGRPTARPSAPHNADTQVGRVLHDARAAWGKAWDDRECCRLGRTVAAEEAEDLATGHIETPVLDRNDTALASEEEEATRVIALAQVAYMDGRLGLHGARVTQANSLEPRDETVEKARYRVTVYAR